MVDKGQENFLNIYFRFFHGLCLGLPELVRIELDVLSVFGIDSFVERVEACETCTSEGKLGHLNSI